MKSALFFLLILIPLPVLMCPDCSLDSIVEKKIQDALSKTDSKSWRPLSCTNVKSHGTLATCPEGSVATSCSCGYGCGSWDIQGSNTCHCQCAGMDWTSARCCNNL